MQPARGRVVVVANEPVWPVRNGGRLRISALARAAAQVSDVTLLEASHRAHPPDDDRSAAGAHTLPQGVERRALPASPVGALAATLSIAPLLGRGLLGAAALAEIRAEAVGAQAVLVSHSYLGACLPTQLSAPLWVDFANLEGARSAAMARAESGLRAGLHRWEGLKARRWEPRLARQAALCFAVSEDDATVLRHWGAAHVAVVPNGTDAMPCPSSAPDPVLLFVASWGYAPNREAARWLIGEVWPRVRAAIPEARLLLAGGGAPDAPRREPGVEWLGWVADLSALYAAASVVAAPVSTGAGTQLKVVEALGHARAIVSTSYGVRSVPTNLRHLVPVADDPTAFAAAVVGLMTDHAARQHVEVALQDHHQSLTWDSTTAPLRSALQQLA